MAHGPLVTIKDHLIAEKEKCFVKFYANVFIDCICFQVSITDSGPPVLLFTRPTSRLCIPGESLNEQEL